MSCITTLHLYLSFHCIKTVFTKIHKICYGYTIRKPIISNHTGYGHLAPSTPSGRLFCSIYALVGIPLCLIVVSALGRLFAHAVQRCCIRVSWCGKRKWVTPLVLILLGSVIFIWLAAASFSYMEKWDYIDAVYFAFITLTTIGFGDMVPGEYGLGLGLTSKMRVKTHVNYQGFSVMKDTFCTVIWIFSEVCS